MNRNRIVPMRQTEREAESYLSNYGGANLEYGGTADQLEYSAEDPEYSGYGDDMVDFTDSSTGGSNSFLNEINSGRFYTLKVVNGNNTDETMVLLPSYDPSSANIASDGNFNSVAGNTLNGTGSPTRLAKLQEFVKNNPMRCLGLKIEATVNTQIGMSMTIQGKSPFRTLESVQVFFANYRNSMTNQDKIVEVPYKHQWDNQTEIRIGIAANCTSTFTWYFGAILNTAKSLRKKADAATTQGSIPARL